MRFLVKRADSVVLAQQLSYRKGGHNDLLLTLLLDEQGGFCAYTERRVEALDTPAVEHFDSRLKNQDDYYNYYAVLQWANQRKRRREAQYADAAFFTSRFFQRPEARHRVLYSVSDHLYFPSEPSDADAQELLDYLGFNDQMLVDQRSRHVAMLRDLFEQAGWDEEQRVAWLSDQPALHHFPTALESAFAMTLLR